MSGSPHPGTFESQVLTEVSRLGRSGSTGVLAVSSDGWTHSRIFFMGGDVIACNAQHDNARLELQLLSRGLVGFRALDLARAEVRKGGDLGDVLVREGHIEGSQLMAARTDLFRDGFLWTAAAPSPQLIWDPRDAVFPDNMQFGVDLESLIEDADEWIAENGMTLAQLAAGQEFVAEGDRPLNVNEAAWTALSAPLGGLALVDALSVESRERAVGVLTSLFGSGALRPMREDDTEDEDHEEQEERASVEDSIRLAASIREAGVDEPELDDLDDYERARRGDFIKSYDVLDKVDLSGVAVLGAGAPDSLEEIPAVEMGDDSEEEDASLSDVELDGMLDVVDQALASSTLPQVPTLSEEPPEQLEPQEDDFDVFDGDLEPLPEEAVAVEVGEPPRRDEDESGAVTSEHFQLPEGVDGPFPREQLREYYGKIAVFNSIFRIIFGTFAEHIGPDNARQRFNALLSSNQRQYPELFQSIQASDDGSVEPAPLLDNLTRCTDRDHGSLLHQGLYELIFSHLYDAKDMLPGDVESEMMERILIYERRLHAG